MARNYQKKKSSQKQGESEKVVDEQLGTYFSSLKGLEQKEMYATEVYNRSALHLRSISDEALEALRTAQSSKKTFEGYDNYQMLRSLHYQTAFQYQSIDNRNEPSDYLLSDVVTKFLYLGKNYQHHQDGQHHKEGRDSSLQNSLFSSTHSTKAQHTALIKARKSKMLKMMAKKMEL